MFPFESVRLVSKHQKGHSPKTPKTAITILKMNNSQLLAYFVLHKYESKLVRKIIIGYQKLPLKSARLVSKHQKGHSPKPRNVSCQPLGQQHQDSETPNKTNLPQPSLNTALYNQ